MSFIIEQEKIYPSLQKTINYSLNINLVVGNNKYSIQDQFEQLLSQYFTAQTIQCLRISQLKKATRISLLVSLNSSIQLIVNHYKNSKNIEKRKRLYLLIKSLKSCELGLQQSIKQLNQQDHAEIVSVLLGLSLFQKYHDGFNYQLEQCFKNDETNNVKTKILNYYNGYNTKLEIIISNIKRLQIKTQQFKLFVISVVNQILQAKKQNIMDEFKRFFTSLIKGQKDINSNILLLFSYVEQTIPIYNKSLKDILNFLAQPKQLLEFNTLFLTLLNKHKFYQLANLYDLVLKQWFNQNNNFNRLFDIALKSQIRHQFINTFLNYLTDFRDAQNILIGYYFRYMNYHLDTEKVFLQQVEVVIGRNYMERIWQTLKQLSVVNTISITGTQLKIRNSNVSLFPKHWRAQTLTEINKKTQSMKSLNSHKVVKQGLSKLQKWQQQQNKKDKTRNRDIVYHEISITIDQKINLVVSLQQLYIIIQLLQNKQKINTLDQNTLQNINEIKEYLNKTIPNNIPIRLVENQYPLVYERIKQKQEIEPPPAYVMEGKIIKLIKRNKKMQLQEISSCLNIGSELIRVILDNLIRKGFVELEKETYHYLP